MNRPNPLRSFARRLLTKEEINDHTPMFQSSAWWKRKKEIAMRVELRQASAHARAVARRGIPEKIEPKTGVDEAMKSLRAEGLMVGSRRRRWIPKIEIKKRPHAYVGRLVRILPGGRQGLYELQGEDGRMFLGRKPLVDQARLQP